MNIINIIIILIILMFGVVGMKRGILKELVVVIGTILVFILAFFLKDFLATFLCKHLPLVQFGGPLGGLHSLSIVFYQLISFLIIVMLLHFVLRILIRISGIIGKVIDATIILAIPNKILGFAVGLLEGYIIVFIALNVLLIPLSKYKVFVDSDVRKHIVSDTPILSRSFGGINEAIEEILTLDESDVNKKNLVVIDTLLKYKVVTPDFVEQLVEDRKLVDIVGIDEVIKKYQ